MNEKDSKSKASVAMSTGRRLALQDAHLGHAELQGANLQGAEVGEAQLIHRKILDIMQEIGVVPKTAKAEHGLGYGIDEIMGRLQPVLVKHGVVMSVSTEDLEHWTESKNLFCAAVNIVVTFTAVADSSFVSIRGAGTSWDYSDKAAGKATSYALKQVLLMNFCLRGHHEAETDSPRLEETGDSPRLEETGEWQKGSKPQSSSPALSWWVEDNLDNPGRCWEAIRRKFSTDKENEKIKKISDAQIARLMAIAKRQQDEGREAVRRDIFSELGIDSMGDIPWTIYAALVVMWGGEKDEKRKT